MRLNLKLSKQYSKNLKPILLSLLFIAFGLWITVRPDEFVNDTVGIYNLHSIRTIGILGIAFFATCGILLIIHTAGKKLFKET